MYMHVLKKVAPFYLLMYFYFISNGNDNYIDVYVSLVMVVICIGMK